MNKYLGYIFILLLFAIGGIFKTNLNSKVKEFGSFDYKFTNEGIKKNFIDAIDLLFIITNHIRFKADINWINFIQNIQLTERKTDEEQKKYIMKTVYTDPYFSDAQLFGGILFTTFSNENNNILSNLISLAERITPNSIITKNLTCIYLMNYKQNITEAELDEIERTMLKPNCAFEYYKLFKFFYKKKKMSFRLKRIYALALLRKDITPEFSKEAKKELNIK